MREGQVCAAIGGKAKKVNMDWSKSKEQTYMV